MLRFLSLSFALLAMLAAGCSKSATTGGGPVPVTADKVYIAVCGPMTGKNATFGDMIKAGALLMQEQIDAAGGIDVKGTKMPVQFVIEDDKGDASEANNVARKIAGDPKFIAVVGHFNSSCTMNARSEYGRVKLPTISPGSTNTQVCEGWPFQFRNLYRDDFQGQSMAVYAQKVFNAKKVAVFYHDDAYGKGLYDFFKAHAAKIGLPLVAELSYAGVADFKPLTKQAVEAGADAVVICGLHNEAGLIVKSLRGDFDFKVPVLGSDGVCSPGFVDVAGDHAEGVLITTPYVYVESQATEAEKSFYSAFIKKWSTPEKKVEPDTWAALTYDACGQLLEAIKTAGMDRQAVHDALAKQTTMESGYKGVTGVTYFDSEGDCLKPLRIAVVKSKSIVLADQQMP